MNYLDLGIFAIVALCATIGYFRGLIRALYRLVSFLLAILLAYFLRPVLLAFLRNAHADVFIRERILGENGLEYTLLPIDLLINITLDAFVIVGVFLLVFVILTVVGSILDVVSKLPAINTLNNIGGLAAGGLIGAGFSWLTLIVLRVFSNHAAVFALLEGSLAARLIF